MSPAWEITSSTEIKGLLVTFPLTSDHDQSWVLIIVRGISNDRSKESKEWNFEVTD